MLINLRNALMAGKRLPYDAEVEYLESTGSQYIDTGTKSTDNSSAEIAFQLSTSAATKSIFGTVAQSSAVSPGFFLGTASNSVVYANNTGTAITPNVSMATGVDYTVTVAGSSVVMNGSAYTADAVASSNYNIYLFARNRVGVAERVITGRIYYFKLYDNGALVRDYIPVRKGTVGYLYDRVTGKLFGNAGTGDFVLGQDVVPMTWQDGLQYNNVGTPIESATSSVGLDYIPITAGHSFTWRLGYGSSASADLIIYNANKERIDYWVARDRTVTISGAAAYMRISALTSYKEQATVYDETAQKYVFANGRIPIGDAS